MPYREVTMFEVKEALRLWLAGVAKKRIAWLGLRIDVGTHHFDSNEGLVALHPGIVSWRDRVRLARDDGLFGAVLHADGNSPGDSVADVRDLALVGLNDRFDAFRPAPPRLEVETPDREPLKLNDLDPGLVRGANLVGRAVGLHLELRYCNWSRHVFLLASDRP